MKTKLDYLLPGNITDETAYHIVNLFYNIAAEIESHYLAQMRRHNKSIEDKVSGRMYFSPTALKNKQL